MKGGEGVEAMEVTGGVGERATGRGAGCWGSWESG